MPELIGGILIEQKVSVVTGASETDINTEIDAQALDNWVVVQLVLSGSDMVILFSRQTAAT